MHKLLKKMYFLIILESILVKHSTYKIRLKLIYYFSFDIGEVNKFIIQ